jgi:hypothetical protein
VPSDDEVEVCVVEWVDTPKDRPITCTFLKPGSGKKKEVRFTFDITKCDKIFDVLLQNNVIRLKGGHTIPTVPEGSTVSGTTLFHIPLMSAITFIDRFNWL